MRPQNRANSLQVNDWENPQVVGINRRPGHTRTNPHATAKGELLLAHNITTHKSLPPIPRIGLTMLMPAGFEYLSWFGRGSFENYRDRNSGAIVSPPSMISMNLISCPKNTATGPMCAGLPSLIARVSA